MDAPAPANPADQPLSCRADPAFTAWLAQTGGSLIVSTYQAGKLLVLGINGEQLSLLPRHFDKPMGLDIQGGRMALATRNGVTLFQDDAVLAHHYTHDRPGRYDMLLLPRLTYHTADANIHDLALVDEEVWFVNTRFSCLATLDSRYSFRPRWKPAFVSELAPEDRCHLNGLAMVDGKAGYVTALGTTDSAGGWREGKASGGVVIDVASSEVILRGLAMPHSPRWHAGQLWVLNSGAGQLLRVDAKSGASNVVCELPGYLRGLCFVGPYAVLGLCKIRESNIFGGMPVQQKYGELQCGIAVVDTRSGRLMAQLHIDSGCTELYDIRFVPQRRRINVLNLERKETWQAMSAPDIHYWLRPENEIKDA